MIANEQQYRVTQEQLSAFRETLRAFDNDELVAPIEPLLREAERNALLSVIADLEEAIAAWEENQ